MKFTKVRDVKSPVRGHSTDAGIDFFVPEGNEEFFKDFKEKNPLIGINTDSNQIVLAPHQGVIIPSGIHVKFAEGMALVAYNKSGVAVKKQLDALACVVDSDYEGEVHINVVNTSNEPQIITCGDKLIQFILLPIILDTPVEVDSIETLYKDSTSERKDGGFGSTGTA